MATQGGTGFVAEEVEISYHFGINHGTHIAPTVEAAEAYIVRVTKGPITIDGVRRRLVSTLYTDWEEVS